MAGEVNTQRVKISREGQGDSVFVREFSKRVAEAAGDPGLAEEAGRLIRESLETGEEVRGEVDSSSGEHYILEARQTSDGEYEIISRNRTREHLTQSELAKKLREAQMHAFLGNQVAELAHEVRNTLTVMMGRARLLLSQYPNDPEVREEASLIISAGNRTKQICDSYMRLHKEQDDKLELTDIHESLDKVVRLLDPIYRAKGVGIEKQYAEDLPHIYASDDMLHSLWLNLIKNAYEAVRTIDRREGKIIITAGQYKGADHDFSVQISVEDNGCGMDEETVRAWKRQDDIYFTKKEEGYGIGRHIIYEVIRKHRMGFSVESKLGQGTKFSLYFPKTE